MHARANGESRASERAKSRGSAGRRRQTHERIDEPLDIDDEAEIVANDLKELFAADEAGLVRAPAARHKGVNHVALVVEPACALLLLFDDLEELGKVDRAAHVLIDLTNHLEQLLLGRLLAHCCADGGAGGGKERSLPPRAPGSRAPQRA